ncbi:MAG: hypothetical protein L6Q98_23240 [Anaerolineae bacterium]|nr:hypothetical protein [Anaerolineae bacterium]
MAIGTTNGYVEIVDAFSGSAVSIFRFSEQYITDIAWSVDNNQLVVTDLNGEARVVDITTGSAERIESINGTLFAVDINPVDQRIVLGGILSDGSTAFKTLNLSPDQPHMEGGSGLCRINTPRAASAA